MNDKIKEIIDNQTEYFNSKRQNRRLNNLIREYFGEDFFTKSWIILFELFRHEFPHLIFTPEQFMMMHRRSKRGNQIKTISEKEDSIEKKTETRNEQVVAKAEEVFYPNEFREDENLDVSEQLQRAIDKGKLEGKTASEVISSWDFENQKHPKKSYFTSPYPKEKDDKQINNK